MIRPRILRTGAGRSPVQARERRPALARTAPLLLLAACGSFESGESSLEIEAIPHAISAGFPSVVGGEYLVYLADEGATGPAGTDLDEDGDTGGLVAIAYRLDERVAYPLGVAAASAVVLDEDVVYLAVREGDDAQDWNGDADEDDLVLLAWTQAQDEVLFVDELAEPALGELFVVVSGRLYYSSAVEPAGGDGTSVHFLRVEAPTTPVAVSAVPGSGVLRPVILGVRRGLLFLGLDETLDGVDRNADGDATDGAVLTLLDGHDEFAEVVPTGLALDAAAPVFAAKKKADEGEYRVAFLVSESAQGGANLNDPADFIPAWEAPQCSGSPDVDTTDAVLHVIELADLVAGPPINTGIAGRDRVVIAGKYAATIASEADAACDLNADGDGDDLVLRWARADTPVEPAVLPEDLLAISQLPGGAFGVARLDGRFLASVDEAADGRDHDGDGEQSRVLLGWLDPDAPAWTFLHKDVDVASGLQLNVGLDWMGSTAQEDRLPISFTEEAQGTSLNSACNSPPLADGDAEDVLPAWVRFPFDSSAVPELSVAGVGLALTDGAGGVQLQGNFAYFCVSETADGVDHDGDGDLDDVLLMRNPLFACDPDLLGGTIDGPGPVIETDGLIWGAFAVDESADGMDWNQDGDEVDVVVRYFRI